jgi:membrane associated rhomboid family serine protease
MREITPVVKQLIIVNIMLFVGSQIIGDTAYSLLSQFYPENPGFHFWQPLTSMFMHAPYDQMITHIIFNMYGLYLFGSPLEHYWGGKRFIVFYLICGLGATLIHTGVNYYHFHNGLDILLENGFKEIEIISLLDLKQYDENWLNFLSESKFINFNEAYIGTAVGASGALYGLLVAFAIMFPNVELMLMFIPFPIKAKFFVPFIVAMDLFSGVTGFSIFGANVAHFAHVGGAIFGVLLMLYWRNNKFKQDRWN